MKAEFKRVLSPPKSSFFLFGPRATGKSTWLGRQLHADLVINLLKAKDFLKYSKNPNLLSEAISGNPSIKCVVIDEIQKIPELLDEVHSIIYEKQDSLQFILTGSSARKLKTVDSNLLAGRALVRKFYPLTAVEIGENFDIEKALRFGLLPKVWTLDSDAERNDLLYAYVVTYLREEIQREALVRNIPGYSSFLEHMALRNAQVINLNNIAKEVGVARSTVQGYLQILEDTLLGISLNPIHLKAKVKEVSNPKFYFFDCGVVRALINELDEGTKNIKGYLLETYVLHELRAYSDYHSKRYNFHYWGTPSENEVDFIISTGSKMVGVEVKSSTRWKKEFNFGLKTLLKEKKIIKGYGVYMGTDVLNVDGIIVIPATQFSKYLTQNSLF